MLEEIIAGLIGGGVLGVVLLSILFRYRKPIKKYENQFIEAFDNWSEEVRKRCEEGSKECYDWTFELMKKFVKNVDEKNMTKAQLETKKLISEIERTGVYPDGLPYTFWSIMHNRD